MNEKEEFLVNLGGPKERGKVITRLMKEQALAGLEVIELVKDAYVADPVLGRVSEEDLYRKLYVGILQLTILPETNCSKSPYGLHAVSNAHQHHCHCAWCEEQVSGF